MQALKVKMHLPNPLSQCIKVNENVYLYKDKYAIHLKHHFAFNRSKAKLNFHNKDVFLLVPS